MRHVLRRCIDCDTLSTASRCPTDAAAHKARRNAEAPRARALVTTWVAANGWVCPGDTEHPAHPSDDLTAEHVVPLSRGGAGGPITVLCRSANSRKGNRL